ncbi:Snf7 family [Babesia duncani]|uniref:Snf7 family n=1 Tax=Babesia duncani TaxID=323732 RepID=A0AAD9PIG3_9APIC|nr:Snf7 family [Babesia duncani]
MGGIFSSLDDKLRENKRRIKRMVRELDRQRIACEREEHTLISRIKVEARQGRTANVRTLARDIVRNRKLVSHYCNMKSHLNAIQSQLQSAHSTDMLATNLKKVSILMSKVSSKTSVSEFQRVMQDLGQKSEVLNLKMDVMSEALDDCLNDSASLDEEDRIVNELLEELGLSTSQVLDTVPVPVSNSITNQGGSSGQTELDNSIMSRIDNLKH